MMKERCVMVRESIPASVVVQGAPGDVSSKSRRTGEPGGSIRWDGGSCRLSVTAVASAEGSEGLLAGRSEKGGRTLWGGAPETWQGVLVRGERDADRADAGKVDVAAAAGSSAASFSPGSAMSVYSSAHTDKREVTPV